MDPTKIARQSPINFRYGLLGHERPGRHNTARRIAIPSNSIPAPSPPPASDLSDTIPAPRGPALGVTPQDQPQVVADEATVYEENSVDVSLPVADTTTVPRQAFHPSTTALARLADGDALYRQRKAAWTEAEAQYQAALAVERDAWRVQQQMLENPCQVDALTGHIVGTERHGRPPALAGVIVLALVLAACAAVTGGWHAPTFTRIDQIEPALRVPVVGVISAIDDHTSAGRKPTASRAIGWGTLGCESLLALLLVWFLLLAVGDENFFSSLIGDPYAAFVEAVDRLPGFGTPK